MTQVPDISQLGNLQKLILDGNEITSPEFHTTSSSLKYLSLKNNNVKSIPLLLPENLETLNLSENMMTYIPANCFGKGPVKIYRVPRPGFGKNKPEKKSSPPFF